MKEKETKMKDLVCNEKEANTKKETKQNTEQRGVICYKSNLLNRYFDNHDELVKAEEAYEKENAEKLRQAEEKKLRAKEVEDAYRNAMQVRKDANKAISEADKKYYELRDAFIRDYKTFHMSYSDDSGDVVIKSFFDIFNW